MSRTLQPFDAALIKLLTTIPPQWTPLNDEGATEAEEQALERLIGAGLVEARVTAKASMDGFPESITLRCRVVGDYGQMLRAKALSEVPEWLDKDGNTRGANRFSYDIDEVRLTSEGELAKQDWQSPEPSMVLSIVRGIMPFRPPLLVQGKVGIEQTTVTRNENGPVDLVTALAEKLNAALHAALLLGTAEGKIESASKLGNHDAIDAAFEEQEQRARAFVNAIDAAIHAIPGVDILVRITKGTPPGAWSQKLKLLLMDFRGLLEFSGNHIPVTPELRNRWLGFHRAIQQEYRELLAFDRSAVESVGRSQILSAPQPHHQDETSETLRIRSLDCAKFILQHRSAFHSVITELLKLPLWTPTQQVEITHKGKAWVEEKPYSENEADNKYGPIVRRLTGAWRAFAEPFFERDRDRYYDLGRDSSLRVMVLAALTFIRDFDGRDFGFDWPWLSPRTAEQPNRLEGRGWVWSVRTSTRAEEVATLELIDKALHYFTHMVAPSLSQKSEIRVLDTSQRDQAHPEWDFFISHASEDRDIAHPIWQELHNHGYRVWIDNLEIVLGDSIREKIDGGLARSRRGIVILSHRFFAKNWTMMELNALAARHGQGEQVILPIHHEITAQEIMAHSPMLADLRGVSTANGIETVISEIRRAASR